MGFSTVQKDSIVSSKIIKTSKIINRAECSEWIALEEGKIEYVRSGWDTWKFYNRAEAARLIALWEERGYKVI
jgi:hypothetical protein